MLNANVLPQIQNMKMQIRNIESQLDNLIIQMQNNPSNVGNQIDNMSIQMFNLGIQFLNIGNQIPNNNLMGNMNMNKNMDILKIIEELNKIVNPQMNMPGMGMPPMNIFPMGPMPMPMPMPMMGSQMPMNNEMKIIFDLSGGKKYEFSFKFGTTLNEIFKKFVNEFEKNNEKVDDPNKRFIFLYCGMRLSFEDKEKIEDYFKHSKEAKITVCDSNNI